MMLSALQFVFSFHGRLNRLAFLLFYLAYGACSAAGILLYLSIGNPEPGKAPLALILALSPGMAAVFSAIVRRLHDRNRSGWWLAAFFLPAISVMGLGNVLVDTHVFPMQPFFDDVLVPLFLLASIPFTWGGIEILILPGTSGPNRFGPQLLTT